MNRTTAKLLAETISLNEIKQMFLNAQSNIPDWTQASKINKGMSKGAAFNVLTAGMDKYESAEKIHHMAKTNMLREFGEHLPNYQKPVKTNKNYPTPTHQDPKKLEGDWWNQT